MSKRNSTSDAPKTITEAIAQCGSALKRYISTIFVSNEDVEEVVHDTYLKALTAERKIEITTPKAYLFAAARNIALNKKARQRKIFFDNMGDFQDLIVDPNAQGVEQDLHWKQMCGKLEHAVASLPPQCRKVFIMQRIQGMSYKEIAKKLSVSPRTVENHLNKALIRCRAYLESDDFEEWQGDNVESIAKYMKQNNET